MARQERGSKDWYVGAANDDTPRTLDIDWSFLPEGEYTAEIYRDATAADPCSGGVDADWQAYPYAITIEKRSVSHAAAPLSIRLASGGGFAIRLVAK